MQASTPQKRPRKSLLFTGRRSPKRRHRPRFRSDRPSWREIMRLTHIASQLPG